MANYRHHLHHLPYPPFRFLPYQTNLRINNFSNLHLNSNLYLNNKTNLNLIININRIAAATAKSCRNAHHQPAQNGLITRRRATIERRNKTIHSLRLRSSCSSFIVRHHSSFFNQTAVSSYCRSSLLWVDPFPS